MDRSYICSSRFPADGFLGFEAIPQGYSGSLTLFMSNVLKIHDR